jgi:H+/Cl- antiporter ClcA
MISSVLNIFWVIGIIFGLLAALMAYLITYNEWTHHYPTKKEPRKIALETAILTFVFFFSLSLISGYFLIQNI